MRALSSDDVGGYFHLKACDPRRLGALSLDLVRLVDSLDAISSLGHQPRSGVVSWCGGCGVVWCGVVWCVVVVWCGVVR